MSNTQLKTIGEAVTAAKPAFDRMVELYKGQNAQPPVVFQREAEFAMQICERNPALAKEHMLPSLMHAIKNVALVGVSLNPALKLAYLVPRDGMACLDISYMGLTKIATDSGSVIKVNCQLVYAKDFFEIEHGTNERFIHRPVTFGERGEIIGVYTIATLHDGSMLPETMTLDEVKKIQGRSKAKNGPWKNDFSEMMRKTCVKRASKYWPKTERLAEAVRTLDSHEGYDDIQNEENSASGQNSAVDAPIDDLKRLRGQVMHVLKAGAADSRPKLSVKDYAAQEHGIESVKEMDEETCIAFLEMHKPAPATDEVIEGEIVKGEGAES